MIRLPRGILSSRFSLRNTPRPASQRSRAGSTDGNRFLRPKTPRQDGHGVISHCETVSSGGCGLSSLCPLHMIRVVMPIRPIDSALAIHQCTEQFVHLSRATTFPSGACLRLRRNQGCAAYCSALRCGGPRPHERALARPVETGAIAAAGSFPDHLRGRCNGFFAPLSHASALRGLHRPKAISSFAPHGASGGRAGWLPPLP